MYSNEVFGQADTIDMIPGFCTQIRNSRYLMSHLRDTFSITRHVGSDLSQPPRHLWISQVCRVRTLRGTKKPVPRGVGRGDLQSTPPHLEREKQECQDLAERRRVYEEREWCRMRNLW